MNTKGDFADLNQGDVTGNVTIFPFTIQQTDVYNPTTIKTTVSKTINLPKTNTNNKIFSNYYELNKLTSLSDFNSLQKTPYKIFHNGSSVLFDGWLKLNSINKDGYEVILSTAETKLFFDLADKKLSDLDLDLTHRIGRFTVWNSWHSDSGIYEYLKYSPAYQGLYDNFTSNKILNSTAGNYIELNKDIDEYQKQEMRSYYQHPTIKISKLIQQIALENNIEFAENDEFFTNDNPYWSKLFMSMPKYYNINKPTSVFKPTYKSTMASTGKIITSNEGAVTTNTVGRAYSTTIYDEYELENGFYLDLSKYPSGVVEVEWSMDIEIEAALSQEIVNAQNSLDYTQYVTPTYYRANPYPDNGGSRLKIKSYISGQNNGYSESDLRYGVQGAFSQYAENYDDQLPTLYLRIPTTYTANNYQKFRFLLPSNPNYSLFRGGIQNEWYDALPTTFRISGKSIINNDGTNHFISFTLNGYDASTKTYTTPAFRLINSVYLPNYLAPYYKNTKLRFRPVDNEHLRIIVKPFNGQMRSNYKLINENILDPTITQSQFFIEYMKIFGLICYYDKLNKKYILSSRNKYFENAERIDWTDKAKPEDGEINPTTIDNRFYTFKWGDISSTHYERYKNVFGTEYGSVKIDSNNQHYDNNSIEELYSSSIFSTPLMEQSYNINNDGNQYRLPWKALSMCTYEGSVRSAAIPTKPTLVFWNGLETFENSVIDGKKNWMIISDDTYVMRNLNEYFWSNYPQSGNNPDSVINCVNAYNQPVFPKFTTLIPYVASLDFGVPRVTFFETEPNALNDKICIFSRFYKKYTLDKYSVHNRIYQVPMKLTNEDIDKFKFNAFYYINNIPYTVIKIVDYNPSANQLTKVYLQRVIDLDAYTGQNIIINDLRTIDGAYFGSYQSTLIDDYNITLSTTYNVPSWSNVSEKGFIIDGVSYQDSTSGNGNISMDIERGYQVSQYKVSSYIVYDGIKYVNDEYILKYPAFTATFTNFTKTQNGDNYIISIEFDTNMIRSECGMYLNGVYYTMANTDSPMSVEVIQNEYQVTAAIIGNDNTIIKSNNYYVY